MLTDQQHPITPPEELVEEWCDEWYRLKVKINTGIPEYVATQAARWGADQELNAVCEWLDYNYPSVNCAALRAAMRPKPPSLAEQALDVLNLMLMFLPPGDQREQGETIRRALEQLND